eukprot:scaffold41244_cov30-Tisochrysis_lutea.AAC.5
MILAAHATLDPLLHFSHASVLHPHSTEFILGSHMGGRLDGFEPPPPSLHSYPSSGYLGIMAWNGGIFLTDFYIN